MHLRQLTIPHKERLSVERINRQAAAHGTDWSQIDFATPIDLLRHFLCPTLTPLYYTSIYRELSAAQALRYNQLTGMCFNELIAMFEESLSTTALAALCRSARLPAALKESLAHFSCEEARHCQTWRALNRLSAPQWYSNQHRVIIRIPRPLEWVCSFISARPHLFPAVIWLMLALEEHSLEISRRCARLPDRFLEPRYEAAYRLHLKDEIRHVHIDWHLIEFFYDRRPARVRHPNALLFLWMIDRLLLRPTHSAMRVFDCLAREFDDLRHRRPAVLQELKSLDRNVDYQRMMYSRTATPILFSLFDRFEEFGPATNVLRDYQPGWSLAVDGRRNR